MTQKFHTKEEINTWLVINLIENFYIHEDLTVSVKGKVNLINKGLEGELPVFFRSIEGSVNLSENALTSLEGLPSEIKGYLDISSNQLKTLKHCPQTIEGHFICDKNDLENLQDGPKYVGGFYSAEGNYIRSAHDFPEHVKETIAIDSYHPLEGLESLMKQDKVGIWVLYKNFSEVKHHLDIIALKKHLDENLPAQASKVKRKI